ncbi:MAG TPA: acyl carrier protein [bacterium]|nr:acyl carrier protein [bacterium]
MERIEIMNKVIALAADKLSADAANIKETTSFIEDLNADSLDVVDFVMELEGAFNIEIPDEDVEKIKTVGAAVEYISGKINA